MTGITILPVEAPLSHITQALERDGVVIVRDFLPTSTIAQMNSLLKPHIAANNADTVVEIAPDGFGEDAGEFLVGNTHRIYGLLGKMPEQITKILQHPVWNGIAKYFLSDGNTEFIGGKKIPLTSGYQMSVAMAFTIMPGAKPQVLHRDQIIHGSFQPRADKVYTSLLTCGLFAVSAARDWVKQEENQFWSTPLEVIRKLPEDVLIRAVFTQASGGAGLVDGQDPKQSFDKLPRLTVKDLLPQ